MKQMTQDEETEFVKQGNRSSENQCDCNRCQKMCQTAPCIGTPTEIIRLMEAGYIDKLSPTTDMAPVLFGGKPVDIIAPFFDTTKQACVFFNEGKCELHESGLKPIEGKLANHSSMEIQYHGSYVEKIFELWDETKNPFNVTKVWLMFMRLYKRH